MLQLFLQEAPSWTILDVWKDSKHANASKSDTYNHGYNILEVFNNLVLVRIATSKTTLDI